MSGPGRRVLIADDEPDVRYMLLLQLRRAGWDVTESADGDDAVGVLDAEGTGAFDALVLDLRMPGRSGAEVARTARSRGFAGPIVLFSGYLGLDAELDPEVADVTTLEKAKVGDLVGTLEELHQRRGGDRSHGE